MFQEAAVRQTDKKTIKEIAKILFFHEKIIYNHRISRII